MKKLALILGIVAVVVVVLVFVLAPTGDPVTLHNRGIAMIYQHEFAKAEKPLRQLVDLIDDDPVLWVNLAIAQLNQEAALDVDNTRGVDRAVTSLKRARELDPDNPNVAYCLGIIYRFLEQEELASAEFAKALELVPENADVHYQHAQTLSRAGELGRALSHFEAAVERNPHLTGAWYNVGQLSRRTGNMPRATEAMERFQRLNATHRGLDRSVKFTEMGALAEPIRDWAPKPRDVADGIEIVFARPERIVNNSDFPFALVDQDRDGVAELWCAGADAASWNLRSSPQRGQALPVLAQATGFAVGDFSEDGVLDVVVASLDGGTVAHQYDVAQGAFTASKAVAGTAGRQVMLLDVDLESDLDLISWSGAAPVFSINTGRELDAFGAGPPPLTELGPGASLLVARDLDGDCDVEFLFTSPGGVALVDNGPQWDFQVNPAGRTVDIGSLVHSIACGDLDNDGDEDLVVSGLNPGIYFNDGSGNFFGPAAATDMVGTWLGHVFDADLDGLADILLAGSDGSRLIRNLGVRAGSSALAPPVELPGMFGVSCADVDGDRDQDLVYRAADGGLFLLRNESDVPHNAAILFLGGVLDEGNERRTNLLGIGARVEVRSGNLKSAWTYGPTIGSGAQGFTPLIVGIGNRTKIDSIYIEWPDGVIQSELDIPVNICHALGEEQRKASSCPLLFTWDGNGFRFITDFMGGGGLGFWTGWNQYGSPDPTETVRIPPDALVAADGEYTLSVMEPMQEVCYVDGLSLRAIDHPAGIEIYPDEIFSTSTLKPTGATLAVKTSQKVFPRMAIDPSGSDAAEALRHVDRCYPSCGKLDPDLVGYAEQHALTLSFGEELSRSGDVRLFLHGWVEYPYSRTNFAAHQGGKKLSPPTFSWRRSPRDEWHVIAREAGYPAGMPKFMVLDVSAAVSSGATEFRIATNMEIYWDQAFVAPVLPATAFIESTIEPKAALMRFGGYPREYSDDGRMPKTYHYSERQPHVSFRKMGGSVTREGDVRELLLAIDDRFAILGGGDELLLSFMALDAPAAGWRRTFLLDTHGYCKDTDTLTALGDTVEPLPFADMESYPPTTGEHPDPEYQRVWNTRSD